MYDVIIVGAGPAGLSAALYTSRRMLKTLIVGKNLGGQAALAERVENYPGIKSISGLELSDKMKKQTENFGTKIIFDEVEKIVKRGENFLVKSAKKKFETKAVILAFGLTPRDLDVPGEKKFIGKGVSYCATCDAPFFKNKIVLVVGGGNSAVSAALYLSKIAKKVYLIHRREGFRAEAELVCQIENIKNIETILNTTIKEIVGKKFVEKVIIKNIDDEKQEREIIADGVFVEAGLMPKTSWIKDLVKIDERNQIVANKNCETSMEGIFVAGDVSDVAFKQIIIAAGEGAKAALMAHKYLLKREGRDVAEAVPFDWGRCK